VRLRRLIRARRIQLVHVNSAVVTAAAAAAWIARVPCVWHVREIDLLRRSRLIGAVLRWCIRRLPDKVVAISGAVADAVGKTDGDRMCVIHHGVDVERFQPGDRAESRRSLGLSTDAWIVGYVGRVSPIKGLEDLIAAFGILRARHSQVQLVIAGPVLQYEDYYAQLNRLGGTLRLDDEIKFLGEVKLIPELMRCFDVLVLPTRVPEGFGLVLLEALASGTPVIAPDAGGPAEILAHCAAARLFPPRDVTKLAAALEDYFQLGEAARSDLAAYAREWTLRGFSATRMMQQLSSVYDELLYGPVEQACLT
jgi:glycosyltransferase involved in cell wall biosynthesis